MSFSAKSRRFITALPPALLAGALLLAPAAAQPPAAATGETAEPMPPQKDKPPLSEEEIFPNLKAPGKNGGKIQPPAPAAKAAAGNGISAAQQRAREENRLLAQLKRTADFKKAAEVSEAIEGLWAQSGSETVDLLMHWANKEIAEKNYAIALDFLDNAVALAPDYAEGWMRRASVHLMTNDIALAMVEIERVLQLNPRQYNAMLQLGAVFEMTGRNDDALAAYEKALKFYPQMLPAQRRIKALLEEKTSRAI